MAQLAYVRPLRGRFYYIAVKPQVTFASLSSPAVMDVRRLRRRSGKRQSQARRRRLLEIDVHNILAKVQSFTCCQ